MKSLLLLPFLFSLALQIECHAQDSLVLYREVSFSSEFEKQVLDDHFLGRRTDYFMLFMANGSLLKEAVISQAAKRFYDALQDLQVSSKRNERKVKTVYSQIHDSFFTKYEQRNKFEEIFYNGYYNCVSATALYALAFEHLAIPYVIREKPTHVYLVAYPQNERILVESTSPADGTLIINQQFKQNYVATLRDQKLISAAEFASRDVNELFDEYYFGQEENISLNQLIGIQYMNEGIYLMEEEKPLEAFHQLEKAYLFHPAERVSYVMMNTLRAAFQSRSQKDYIHAQLLAKLSRYKNYGILNDMVYGEFSRVVNELLFEKGQAENLKKYYEQLIALLHDDAKKTEITFIYNTELGRYHYNQARFSESLPFYQEALKLKPKHHDVTGIFVSAIAQSTKKNTNDGILKTLEKYAKQYPFLLENNVFNEMLGTAYLIEFDFHYRRKAVKEAEHTRMTFEKFRETHNGLAFDSYLVGQAYSAAAVYYFRIGQVSKAKRVIAQGLELAPGNYELLARKRMIDQ